MSEETIDNKSNGHITAFTGFYHDMETRISVSTLRQRTASMLARVMKGETFLITIRGRPVARLCPLSEKVVVEEPSKGGISGNVTMRSGHTLPCPLVFGSILKESGGPTEYRIECDLDGFPKDYISTPRIDYSNGPRSLPAEISREALAAQEMAKIAMERSSGRPLQWSPLSDACFHGGWATNAYRVITATVKEEK